MKRGGEWLILGLFVLVAIAGGIAVQDSSSLVDGVPDIVKRFGDAIAEAEGYWISGSVPNRKNNPGDLKRNGVIAVFDTAEQGFQALYEQVYKMFYGGSRFYNPTMTIDQVAYLYADGKDDPVGAKNWAANVAGALGVTTDTKLEDLMV
jgi:hypothetical protein